MEVSILIVTKNRPEELAFTLEKVRPLLDLKRYELRVFIDGCPETRKLQDSFPWVHWEGVATSIGASAARNNLYKKGKGAIFIGLDDDAHPISFDFISHIQSAFEAKKNIGILAFQEVKGVFASDDVARAKASSIQQEYFTNDFIGCGFAIKKEIYNQTNGFPVWIDIYGEEGCVAIEVLDLGYQIKYVSYIMVNHRVDTLERIKEGRYYFRFEKQLKNTIFYYLVYMPNPYYKIAKLLFHNFRKYALKDTTYFKLFCKSCFQVVLSLASVLRHRKPIKQSTLEQMKELKGLQY
jgi:GT2 family glycosyltransferase